MSFCNNNVGPKFCIICGFSDTDKGVKYMHSLPKKPEKRKVWLTNMNIKFETSRHHKICSRHFLNGDYINDCHKPRLRPEAAPTLLPAKVSSPKLSAKIISSNLPAPIPSPKVTPNHTTDKTVQIQKSFILSPENNVLIEQCLDENLLQPQGQIVIRNLEQLSATFPDAEFIKTPVKLLIKIPEQSNGTSLNNILNKVGTYFTKDEELLLLQEIKKHKHILYDPGAPKHDKDEVWKKILISFNTINFQARSLDQLKSKYVDMKGRTAISLSSNPGAAVNGLIQPTFDEIFKFITTNVIDPPKALDPLNTNKNDVILPVSTNNSIAAAAPSTSTTTKAPIQYSNNKINQIAPSPLPTAKRGHVRQQNVPRLSHQIKRKQLRPKICYDTLLAKQEYYKKKAELVQATIDDLKRRAEAERRRFEEERINQKRKERLEDEEHRKRCTLLDLKIRLAQNRH